ncbi:hypothetical protein MARPO_0005s0240 [Marchantia polymorpha]|uniref:Uncharacterized protein n=1 Tax=Marchantia polymorpha TaxID=3197 RepID=A0A2R6XR85_MARPO|nr:hypothetical protein MARPO_0005s0240 [Marchantia polymorpha]|eukprot:PTQ48621.1 hypothetical protein MARPO_0005s0240 [Marchantia polymorpha]
MLGKRKKIRSTKANGKDRTDKTDTDLSAIKLRTVQTDLNDSNSTLINQRGQISRLLHQFIRRRIRSLQELLFGADDQRERERAPAGMRMDKRTVRYTLEYGTVVKAPRAGGGGGGGRVTGSCRPHQGNGKRYVVDDDDARTQQRGGGREEEGSSDFSVPSFPPPVDNDTAPSHSRSRHAVARPRPPPQPFVHPFLRPFLSPFPPTAPSPRPPIESVRARARRLRDAAPAFGRESRTGEMPHLLPAAAAVAESLSASRRGLARAELI